MRKIDTIIVHCSATKEGKNYSAADIDLWHRQRGFNEIGYHYVIGTDGKIEAGRDIVKTGAHCQGHNTGSVGICYIGGLDHNGDPKDTRTRQQKESLVEVITSLIKKYPGIEKIVGHRDTGANKACPCFDATDEYKKLLG